MIAATNKNLNEEIEKGNFREDLFYRLNVFPIQSPPLRDRLEDIPLLVNHFIDKYSKKLGKQVLKVTQGTLDALKAYHWPGNIRELENLIERAIIISPGDKLIIGDWLPKNKTTSMNKKLFTMEEMERKHIMDALKETDGRVSGENGAASLLKMNAKTLDSRMRKLNIPRK